MNSAASPDPRQILEQRQQATVVAFRQVEDSTLLELSHLTLPEIREIQQEIARVLPAGNLPAFVLSGLVKLKGRHIGPERVHQDLRALFQGVSLLPQGLYGIMVAGPAAVLHAYQKLLHLAGKDLSSAFPYGTWQFYLQFGLREDAARHTNETVGFQRALSHRTDPLVEATAWICAISELLHRYDDLLTADWEERVKLRALLEEARAADAANAPPFATLVRDWNRQRPYRCPPNSPDYLFHRRSLFRKFFEQRLRALPAASQKRFHQRYRARQSAELAAYQEQMSILATLEPDRYYERKEPIPLWQAVVGFIWQGHTYLLPACQQDERGSPLCYPPSPNASPIPLYALPSGELCDARSQPLIVNRSAEVRYRHGGRLLGCLRPPPPDTIQGWLAAILSGPSGSLGKPPTLDLLLAWSPRSLQPELRGALPTGTREELESLRRAPIIVNWDLHACELPLAYVRRSRRGIGDHALTIFRTDRSMVFDQSHVFFDGMWGLAVSEITTHNAVHWYRRLAGRPRAPQMASPGPLKLTGSPKVKALARSKGRRNEAAAESAGVDMHRLSRLRKWLHQRGVHLTVNDLLLLYRFFHAAQYRPSAPARQALEAFRDRASSAEARAAYQAIETTLARFHETNPALLIPMDASNVAPRERIFPTTFRNPLTAIKDLFASVQKQQRAYQANPQADRWAVFDRSRRELLAYLKTFGELLDALKAVTMRGESFNTATIRLLAHLPPSMQSLLDQVPQRVGVLNEIIKGNEVFSNVGRVAPGASLSRFTSAKDDGETKELVWGVLTDDRGRMKISLRDFRPFVPLLLALGEDALADTLAQDYLESYVEGFNRFVVELSAIITMHA